MRVNMLHFMSLCLLRKWYCSVFLAVVVAQLAQQSTVGTVGTSIVGTVGTVVVVELN